MVWYIYIALATGFVLGWIIRHRVTVASRKTRTGGSSSPPNANRNFRDAKDSHNGTN